MIYKLTGHKRTLQRSSSIWTFT